MNDDEMEDDEMEVGSAEEGELLTSSQSEDEDEDEDEYLSCQDEMDNDGIDHTGETGHASPSSTRKYAVICTEPPIQSAITRSVIMTSTTDTKNNVLTIPISESNILLVGGDNYCDRSCTSPHLAAAPRCQFISRIDTVLTTDDVITSNSLPLKQSQGGCRTVTSKVAKLISSIATKTARIVSPVSAPTRYDGDDPNNNGEAFSKDRALIGQTIPVITGSQSPFTSISTNVSLVNDLTCTNSVSSRMESLNAVVSCSNPILEGLSRTENPFLDGLPRTVNPFLEGLTKTGNPFLEGLSRTENPFLEGLSRTEKPFLEGLPETEKSVLEGIPRTEDPCLEKLPMISAIGSSTLTEVSGDRLNCDIPSKKIALDKGLEINTHPKCSQTTPNPTDATIDLTNSPTEVSPAISTTKVSSVETSSTMSSNVAFVSRRKPSQRLFASAIRSIVKSPDADEGRCGDGKDRMVRKDVGKLPDIPKGDKGNVRDKRKISLDNTSDQIREIHMEVDENREPKKKKREKRGSKENDCIAKKRRVSYSYGSDKKDHWLNEDYEQFPDLMNAIRNVNGTLRLNENNKDGKSPLDCDKGRLKKGEEERKTVTGVISYVNNEKGPKKGFGFIKSIEDEECLGKEAEELHFYLDNVLSYSFILKKGDIVKFQVREPKGKNKHKKKSSATSIILLKPVFRSFQEMLMHLDRLDDEIRRNMNNNKLSNVDIARMVGCHVIRHHLLEMFSNVGPDGMYLVMKLIKTITNLSKLVTSILDENFRQMLRGITSQNFFNPFQGTLIKIIKDSTGAHNLQLLYDFLLLIIKYVPEKSQAVITMSKPLGNRPDANRFLLALLETISKSSPGSITDMAWDNLPLIMTEEEIHSMITNEQMNLQPVRCKGPYSNPTEYVERYYRLLRTDCFAALKEGIQDYLNDRLDVRDMHVYKNMTLYGVEVTKDCLNLAFKVEPPTADWIGIDWEACSNLMFGNLLCISIGGSFKDVIWATVADRLLLEQENIILVQTCNELNKKHDGEVIIDMTSNQASVTMVESPTYYRAHQPVLKALQSIDLNEMNFVNEIVYLKQGHEPFFKKDWTFDASIVYKQCDDEEKISIQEFINTNYNGDISILDESQEAAVKLALSRNVGIIQGPPGTGKSFIGLQMVRIILSLNNLVSPKILLLTYKNHVLDEFTKSCLEYFPSKIVRMGGGSQDPLLDDVSLASIRRKNKINYHDLNNHIFPLKDEIRNLKQDIECLVGKLRPTESDLEQQIMSKLSAEQRINLIRYCRWSKTDLASFGVSYDNKEKENSKSKRKQISTSEVNYILQNISHHKDKIKPLLKHAFRQWLPEVKHSEKTKQNGVLNEIGYNNNSNRNKETASHRVQRKDDADMELKMKERERVYAAGKRKFYLHREAGRRFKALSRVNKNNRFAQTLSTKESSELLTRGQKELLDSKNLWDLNASERHHVIQYIQCKRQEEISDEFEIKVKSFNQKVAQLTELQNQLTSLVLKDKQIVAMTITGASIHHMLLKEIQPEVLIVEEAAEILEPQLVAAIGNWSKYMLIIGDHYQLKPSVESYTLRRDFHFDISMMERLITNGCPYSTLALQNRQRPEFAELLTDIYPALKTNFKMVEGNKPATCLAKSMFFWDHDFPESKERSVVNEEEGERAVMLALFLVLHGYEPCNITILAAYQGQSRYIKKRLHQILEENRDLFEGKVTYIDEITDDEECEINQVLVHTIDTYQGDENDFVIVSLVRSNEEKRIGFLKERNRRCVAQSRARRGLYFIGNSEMFDQHPIWSPMMTKLRLNDAVGQLMEIKCPIHCHTSTKVSMLTFDNLCQERCDVDMICGNHKCNKTCQPSHEHDTCEMRISFTHEVCGHVTTIKCSGDISDKACTALVSHVFPKCQHKVNKRCFEDDEKLTCSHEELVKLPKCGHFMTKPCNVEVDDLKCEQKRVVNMPCGHSCIYVCKADPKSIKSCETCEEIELLGREKQKVEDEKKRRIELKKINGEIDMLFRNTVNKGEVTKCEIIRDPGHTENDSLFDFLEEKLKKYMMLGRGSFPLIQRIYDVTNNFLRIKFLTAKKKIFDPEFKSSLHFYETSDEGLTRITTDRFYLPDIGDEKFGCGLCFPSDSSKYTQCYSEKGSKKLILCEVLTGKPLIVDDTCEEMDKMKLLEQKCDSLLVQSNHDKSYEEVMVYDSSKVYPKFEIHYEEGKWKSESCNIEIEYGENFASGRKEILPSEVVNYDHPLDIHLNIADSHLSRLKANLRKVHINNDYSIKKLNIYMNPKLKKNFDEKRIELTERYGVDSIASEILVAFKGTNDTSEIEDIMVNNFPLSPGKFGTGIYFPHIPSCVYEFEGTKCLIVAKVLPGRIYSGLQNIEISQLLESYDSRGDFLMNECNWCYNELVVFDRDHVLPCYVIEL